MSTSQDPGATGALPRTDDVDGLTVADVMPADVSSMPSTATVGELRDWFAVIAPRWRPGLPAADGRDLVLASDVRRIPVVDGEARFLGVLAVTSDLRHFACRPWPADGRA